MARPFGSLSEKEILALAISSEEEDGRIYADVADALSADFPASAEVFRGMVKEEAIHRHRLIELFQSRFGDHIPLIQRYDVKGFLRHKPVWMMQPVNIESVRKMAATMELETRRFYETAAKRTEDANTRKLLFDLAEAEREHVRMADELEQTHVTDTAADEEKHTERRLFVMQIIQPALAGLMDGSVSTLAPLFAAAFATKASHDAFLVGLAASIGAGISMGFAEALSDDGSLTGRGSPFMRGFVCGLATTLGGLGHTLPYLIPSFYGATAVAAAVVFIEMGLISWIRAKYMDTPILSAAFQVVVGGVLVFLTGIVIGSG